ncbi:tail fiber domain-containing protein [Chryseobacterium sp.]|uniref:tail fiber domain-containing protein n=1 Tax=Chryseobacterium sp. TaxID=1871047 RepID=UPI0025BFB26F|nr:tail fiber domain-containing protein [Chryseobacterium sp.]MBV8325188.1 tail fiber domain-containing protein [Chryseobacterium sp.]
MKKNIYLLGLLMNTQFVIAQVGVHTSNPQGSFHVDGGKDNATTGVPTAVQQLNDFVVKPNGTTGIGTLSPGEKLEVNGNVNVINSQSSYGSYLRLKSNNGTEMTIQAVVGNPNDPKAFQKGGYIGTNTADPLQFIYNNSPIAYLNNTSISPNGTNQTSLGNNSNRWNTVYSAGSGFDANNVTTDYVGLQAESKEGVKSKFMSAASGYPYGASILIGAASNTKLAFLVADSPTMYMDGQYFYPRQNNTYAIGSTTSGFAHVYSYVFDTMSDIRLKKNINNLTYGINDVMKIRSVSYDLKDGSNTKPVIGFIAQEIEKVVPEIVTTAKDKDAYKAVDYTKLIPVLVKAIQDQQAIIRSHEKSIKEMKLIIDQQAKEIKAFKK